MTTALSETPSMRRLGAALLLALTVTVAHANEAAPLADDPVVEQRLLAIAEEVRCLVCQNESLAGSRADLAQDLRREIRGLIREGKTDAEVMDFLVSRYGDYVRYRPPMKPTTWLLWGGPFALLAAGIAGLLVFVGRRRRAPGAELSFDERREAAALLEGADR
jgi:cytochrome c-type biogenesis protein CcmH